MITLKDNESDVKLATGKNHQLHSYNEEISSNKADNHRIDIGSRASGSSTQGFTKYANVNKWINTLVWLGIILLMAWVAPQIIKYYINLF